MTFLLEYADKELQDIISQQFNDSVDEEQLLLSLQIAENESQELCPTLGYEDKSEEDGSENDLLQDLLNDVCGQEIEIKSTDDDKIVLIQEGVVDENGTTSVEFNVQNIDENFMKVQEGVAEVNDREMNENGELPMDIDTADIEEAKAGEVDDQILKDYIRKGKNKNTLKKTEQDVKRFEEFIKSEGYEQNIIDLSPKTMNYLLGCYLLSLKKKDGSDYEPDTLTSIQRSIDRYLKDNEYCENILESDLFKSSRGVLKIKRNELKGKGLGNKPNAAEPLRSSHVQIFWEKKLISLDEPEPLQNGLYFYMCESFGFRGRHEGKQLCWGDISLKTDEENVEYLEFNERLSKTRTGEAGSGASRKFAPKMFAQESERCPVKMYKIFAEKRPEKMENVDSPFFIAVNKSKNATTWYKNQPLGEHSLAKIVSSMCKKAGIEGRLTNHSIRKKTCTDLLHNSVNPTVICQLTGHKNVGSILNYAVASHDMQKEMSKILLNDEERVSNRKRSLPCSEDVVSKLPALEYVDQANVNSQSVVPVMGGDVIPCSNPNSSGNTVSSSMSKTSSFLQGNNFHGSVTINFSNHYHTK